MDAVFEELGLDLTHTQLPRYIAVEGCIGVGKTTLARNIAQLFNYDVLLEQPEENPFLERFYRDPKSTALPTQLFFLFQRANQLQALRQDDIFEPVRVADFLIEKDQLFARTTLDDDELAIYRQVYDKLVINAPRPDLVIYLQAPLDVLLERIRQARTQGWCLVNQELEEGLISIAAPLTNRLGQTVAALNISGQANRTSAELMQQTLLPPLLRAAQTISRLMGAPRR